MGGKLEASHDGFSNALVYNYSKVKVYSSQYHRTLKTKTMKNIFVLTGCGED